MVGAVTFDLWPTGTQARRNRRHQPHKPPLDLCVPVGAAYTADGAGGRTLAPSDSWREGVPRRDPPAESRRRSPPSWRGMKHRRQWTVVTDPTVDLIENNPSRLVNLGTLETFTTATANGPAGEPTTPSSLGAPSTGRVGNRPYLVPRADRGAVTVRLTITPAPAPTSMEHPRGRTSATRSHTAGLEGEAVAKQPPPSTPATTATASGGP